MKTETSIVRKIKKFVHSAGGRAWHVHGSSLQPSGEPDIDGYLNGFHLKIEVKTPKGKPTQDQLHRLCDYNKAGYVVGIVTDVYEFINLIDHYRHKETIPAKYLTAWLSKEKRDFYERHGYLEGHELLS